MSYQSLCLYAVMCLTAGTINANESYNPYNTINHKECKRTAHALVQQVADTAGASCPSITWSSQEQYPYPDHTNNTIVLPTTAFTYHFFGHEATRCAAGVIYNESDLKEYIPQRLRIYNALTAQRQPDTHNIACNQYAIKNNPYPWFTIVALDFWSEKYGYNYVCQQLRNAYKHRSHSLDTTTYNKLWHVHKQIDDMCNQNL